MEFGNVIDHLKNAHGSIVCRIKECGQGGETDGHIYWPIAHKHRGYGPVIANVDGQTFLLNCTTSRKDFLNKYWVTVLGTKEVAQRYEVKITAAPEGNTTITAVMKVHSTDMSKTDVLKDPEGTLEISKNMAERMAQKNEYNRAQINIDYHIIRK